MSGPGLSLTLPEELFGAISERAAERVLAQLTEREPGWPEWMSVETAARYLNISPERVRKLQSRGVLPVYQEARGCRVFFRRSELDQAMESWRTSCR